MKQEFSKSQLLGSAVLCVVLLLVIVALALIPHSRKLRKEPLWNDLQGRIDSFEASLETYDRAHYTYKRQVDTVTIYMHEFDPNTADSIELRQVGFSAWQARNMLKYRAKGGKYRQVEALHKIYGMTDSLYAQIAPYVVIDTTVFADTVARVQYVSHKKDTVLDLNHCDTTELQMIRGIGSVMATRIVRYREQLGGYYSPLQLLEIEGLQENDSAFLQCFTADAKGVEPLRINHLSSQRLSRHPYLRFEQADAIYQYRRRYGLYKEVEDLYNIEGLDSLVINRLRPYIGLE